MARAPCPWTRLSQLQVSKLPSLLSLLLMESGVQAPTLSVRRVRVSVPVLSSLSCPERRTNHLWTPKKFSGWTMAFLLHLSLAAWAPPPNNHREILRKGQGERLEGYLLYSVHLILVV